MEDISNHPAFGIISISRCSTGSTSLVGSEIKHTNFFHLSIKEAEKHDSFGVTNFYSRKSLIDIWLSPNQFLDLVTQLNISEGTPCTIRYVNGIERERPIGDQPRIQKAAEYGRAEVQKSVDENYKLIQEIMTTLEGVSTKKKSHIEQILKTMVNNQKANADFYLQRIVEATDKSIQIAKTEIDSYVGSVVRQLGVKSLQEISKSLSVKEIKEKE